MKIECPHCGQHIAASQDFSGCEAICPGCEGTFICPVFDENPPPEAPILKTSGPSIRQSGSIPAPALGEALEGERSCRSPPPPRAANRRSLKCPVIQKRPRHAQVPPLQNPAQPASRPTGSNWILPSLRRRCGSGLPPASRVAPSRRRYGRFPQRWTRVGRFHCPLAWEFSS